MGKKEKFTEILKDAGISEYWATPDFDPDVGTCGGILIPTNNLAVALELRELYPLKGSVSQLESLKGGVCIDFEKKDSPLFNMVLGYKNTLRQVSL